MKLSCGGATLDVRVEEGGAWIGSRRVDLAFSSGPGSTLDVWLDGRRQRAALVHDGTRLLVWCEGRTFTFEPAGGRRSRSTEHAGDLVAPMPGRVRKTLVRLGERVEKGQVVLILEAMKMEHSIRAPRAGVLSRLAHPEGDLVEAGAELAVIE